ncbi:MAG TPA: ABC transporter permease [Polyangiaceae bacterium]|nr:ABC transporter permease [Polyangiaceae bacterium]
MIDLAWKMLFFDKVRFLITISGVAFAVMLVLVQTGLFGGLLHNATVTIEHMDADIWITSRNSPNLDFVHQFSESNVERVRAVQGVKRADNLILSFMQVSLPNGSEETAVVYALSDFETWGVPWLMTQGNLDDLKRGPHVIFDEFARKRFGEFQLGDYRELNGNRLKIVGTTRDAKSFTTTPLVFIDYHRAQQIQPDLLRGRASYILVKTEPGADVEQVMARLRDILPYNDVYTSKAWAERSRKYWVENTGIGFNAFLTVFLGCLVGVVVVAQTLYTSTMEHLREFGTVKAIGGSNWDIYQILGKQAVLSAIFGFVLGYIPARLLEPIVEKGDLKLIIPSELSLMVLVGTVALCLFAAAISFRKVSNIDPALVFRV